MTIDIYKSIINFCPILLKPIVKILLSSGVSYKQFSVVARQLYVECALSEFGISGRPTNVSRASIITGISRSEVTKLKHKIEEGNRLSEEDEAVIETLSNASQILYKWFTAPEYLDSDGKPKILSIKNDTPPSFASLMKDHGGGLPTTTMLKELLKTKSVELVGTDQLKALNRSYKPLPADPAHILRLAHVVSDFATTMHTNMIRQVGEPSKFEARAFNTSIPKEVIPEFQIFMQKNGMEFLQRIDNWLNEREVNLGSDNNDRTTLGAGLYMIENSNNIEEASENV